MYCNLLEEVREHSIMFNISQDANFKTLKKVIRSHSLKRNNWA